MPELDIRGKVCPDPTIETYQALSRLPPEETLTVICDYPPARQTIPPIAQRFNRACEIREEGDGQFLILIAQVPVEEAVSP
jgi:TusA-related sulfurtransferase